MGKSFFFCALLFACAMPAWAEESCTLKRFGKIPFNTDERAHVMLDATIGGAKGTLMLDTGAYWSVLNKTFAARNNLRSKDALYIRLVDAAGERITKVTNAELKLGALSYGEVEFFLGGIGGDDPTEEVGVIGQNLLAKMDLEIDNAGRTISFFSQEHCKGAGVYWADEAVTLEFKQRPRAATGSRARREEEEPITPPIVAAELDGEVISILFDTGATYSVLDLDSAKRRFGIGPDTPGVAPAGQLMVGGGSLIDTYSYTFSKLTIAGITFENVPIRLAKLDESKQMLLGMHEMKHLRIYFANRDGLIHITGADAGQPQQ